MKTKNKLRLLIAFFSLFFVNFLVSQVPSHLLQDFSSEQPFNDFMKAQNNEEFLLATRKDIWQGSDDVWAASDSVEFFYNQQFLCSEYIVRKFENGVWLISIKHTFEYDENDNLILWLWQDWIGGEWVNVLKETYEYDNNNNQTLSLRQHWNNAIWTNSLKHEYEYNTDNNLILRSFQIWEASEWTDISYYIYEYDNDNNLVLGSFYQWAGGQAHSSARYVHEYNMQNKVSRQLHQRLNSNDSTWRNVDQWLFEYDANNNLTLLSNQFWNGLNWYNNSQDYYEYNVNNNTTSRLKQKWEGGSWVNDFRVLYYYELVNTVEVADFASSVFTISPNPNIGKFSIDRNQHFIKRSRLNIYNSIGQLVYNKMIEEGIHQKLLDLTGFSEGIYFIQITNYDKQVTQPLYIRNH